MAWLVWLRRRPVPPPARDARLQRVVVEAAVAERPAAQPSEAVGAAAVQGAEPSPVQRSEQPAEAAPQSTQDLEAQGCCLVACARAVPVIPAASR